MTPLEIDIMICYATTRGKHRLEVEYGAKRTFLSELRDMRLLYGPDEHATAKRDSPTYSADRDFNPTPLGSEYIHALCAVPVPRVFYAEGNQ